MSDYLKMDHTTTGGKFGTGGSVGDQWHRRWFVLHNDAIEYHETERDATAGNRPLGIWSLMPTYRCAKATALCS